MHDPKYTEDPEPVKKPDARTVWLRSYVGSNKDAMRTLGQKAGLFGQALEMFSHAGSEIEVEWEVDVRNGTATLVKVAGKSLR